MNRLIIWGLALAVLGMPLTAGAQGTKTGKGPKQLLKVEGKLTADDPRGNKFAASPQKKHEIKLQQGTLVRIDLTSKQVDSYVLIEDETGTVLAEDDDSGGDWNSRLLFTPAKTGTYRLVVTCYPKNPQRPGITGDYVLTVVANPAVGDLKKHEALMVSGIGLLTDLTKALESVKNAETAKTAAVEIEKIAVRMQAMQKASKELAPLAPADDATLKSKYERQLKEATGKLIPAAQQAGMNCMMEPTFLQALKKLQNVK